MSHQTRRLPPNILNNKILLLLRRATRPHYPNIWELLSRKVEDEDPTLLDAAVRQCFEETDLTVTAFICEGKRYEYSIEGRGLSLQLNFVVQVVRQMR